tara:strand:+ start:240 stop:500 length:261 start_codon:yes stop_codon:yes gene_type:complete
MALSYLQLTEAELRQIDFSQVLEDSWDTSRWDSRSSAAIVHWEGSIPATIKALRIDSRRITTQTQELSRVKNSKNPFYNEGAPGRQ